MVQASVVYQPRPGSCSKRASIPATSGSKAWRPGTYNRGKLSASFNTFLGPELPHDDHDYHGAISGTPQVLKEVTATLEHRPAPPLVLRLEGRYARSSAAVFAHDRVGSDGQAVRNHGQFLLLLGAVASF